MSVPFAAGEILPVDQIDPDVEPWVSATQVDTYELCARKWGFRWLDGVKAPPNKFAQLGLDTHGPMEDWLKHARVPTGNDKASLLAQALIPYTPPPQAVRWEDVEREELLVVEDVLFVVKIDLFMPSVEYAQRLCQLDNTLIRDTDSGPVCQNGHGAGPYYEVLVKRPRVYDHKTCGDFKWCVTEHDIQYNAQGALYALWTMLKTEERVVDLQWNYVRTKGAIKVNPVFAPVSDAMIVPRMEKSVQTGREIKWHLKNTKRALDIAPDPRACDEYGGCPYRDRCGITAKERIVHIMSDFKNQPGTHQFLQNFGNGQPGLGPNGQPLVNPPAFQPPPGAPQFAPPPGAPQFAPPPGAPQFAPPPGAPQFAPPPAAPTQFSPPPGFATQGPPATPQFAPPQAPPAPQAPQGAPPWQPPQAAQQALPFNPATQPQWQAAPTAAWQPPPGAPQPAPAQPFVPPAAPTAAPAAVAEKGPGRPSKSKEHDLAGAWARFAAAALPITQGNVAQAAQIADALVSELKQRQ